MLKDKIRKSLYKILTDHFDIDIKLLAKERFLEELHENFKILGYLIFLEQLINKEFNVKVPLLENINSAIHTPEDIVQLIERQVKK
jgi:hypothetical protein